MSAHETPAIPEHPHPHDTRFVAQRIAAKDPWYAVALAKAALVEPEAAASRRVAMSLPISSTAAVVMRYPAIVAGSGVLLGILLWRSPWSRNALRLAVLWGIKNVVSRKLPTLF